MEAGRARGWGRCVEDEGCSLVLLDCNNVRAAGGGEKIDLVLWVFAPESLQRERDERLRGDDGDAGLPCASSWLETSPT